ncbi:hypothetical protein GC173_01180 [bacterium]|nr:hypothetical protein [bacterium]
MIPTSEAWRFVAPLDETNYWEDTVAQHLVTEHRAIRRTFSAAVSGDEAAMEEIVSQVRLAAACNPSALPRVYQLETLEGGTSVIFEYIEGRTLEDLINHEGCKKTLHFCRWAIRLVGELAELRRSNVCFERLDATQIVIGDCEQLRVHHRSPIGSPSPEALERSPLLKRLHQLPRIGVYTASSQVDAAGERKVIATLLLQMICASTKQDLDGWLAKSPRPEYGHNGIVSQLIERVLQGEFESLDRLQAELRTMHEAEAGRHQKEMQAQALASAPPPPRSSPATTVGSLASSAPAPTPRRTASPAPEETNPWAAPAALPTANNDPAPRSWGVAAAAEDENPWAAPPAGAVGPTADPPSAGPRPDPISASSSPTIGRKVPSGKKPPIALIGAAVAVVLVLVGGYVLVDVLRSASAKPNEKPTAVIKAPASLNVKAEERIRFDARGSNDPENATLSYKWEVTAPDTTSVIWTKPSDRVGKDTRLFLTTDGEVIAQFMKPGTVTIQLTVSDGISWSDAVPLTFEVTPAF